MACALTKTIFLEVPRTGSGHNRWLFKGLGILKRKIGHNHALPEELEEYGVYRKFKKFCFVRSPDTWYKSFWAHRMTHGWLTRMKGDALIYDLDFYCEHDKFDGFMKEVMKKYPNGFLGEFFPKYTEACDFVGRYENLKPDVLRALIMFDEYYDKEVIRKKGRINRSSTVWWDKMKYKGKIYEYEKKVFKMYYD